jgi:hypothetical protein
MHKTIQNSFSFSLLAILMIVIAGENCYGQVSKEKASDRDHSLDRSIQLFDGHTLQGWYKFLQYRGRDNDPKAVFTVVDGMIRVSGEEWGCITTDEEYENYKITLEYRWGNLTYEPRLKNARDCGLLLHSRGEDGGSQGIWMHSIECQIIEGGTGDFIVVGDGSDEFQITCNAKQDMEGNIYFSPADGNPITVNEGRINWYGRDPQWKDVLGFRGKNDMEKPAGEWNTLECVAFKDQVSVFLNGTLVNKAIAVKPEKGRIQIQSEGAEVFLRRVELTPLSE